MKEIMIIGGKVANIYGIENIDGKTISQFCEAMSQDYVTKGALMPDAHVGYALPIGGVVSCKEVIVPAYVGYDIGCGMCAFQLKNIGMDEVKRNADSIFNSIYNSIPVGQNHHKVDQKWDYMDYLFQSPFLRQMFQEKGGLRQIGTLGGGNHFIEIGWDKDGDKSVWIVIHSGSRNVGHSVGTHYMRVAGGGKVREGHYPLDINSDDAGLYVIDMNFCLEFALENRKQMADKVLSILNTVLGKKIEVVQFINRNHNHAEFKNDEWIHRKGATHADKDMMGVIPGNMRDGSFIVRGLGNVDSLCSSSHGAGRLFSRTEAKEKLSVDDFRKGMSDIKANVGKGTLDESFGAYKNVHKVMDNQEELVEVVAHVKPIINIKG